MKKTWKKAVSALLTLAMVLSVAPVTVMAEEWTTVTTNDELKTALTKEDKNIYVKLEGDLTYDVAAWSANAMGGESTETITIDGQEKYTLTFNQTNSDWNNIVTNGATLVLKNMKVTNSGHNDGPWNRHDLNFACDVEMYNVASDKAMAFKADASLEEVLIDDPNTSDTYAIWIQPNGQTVSLTNCIIDMEDCSDGRGIKIDEQYVDEPQKVTLKVEDTSFKTEEKAAIIVKSKAGADITLSEVNIEDVAADAVNPVWVDEDCAEYVDKVDVTGGSMIVEGSVAMIETADSTNYYGKLDDAFKDAEDGDKVKVLKEGTYALSTSGKNITITGAVDGVVFDNIGAKNMESADVTFNNVTFNYGNEDYKGLQHSGNLVYNDCVINGKVFLYGESDTFNNCTFNQTVEDYNVWTYAASANVEANKVVFNECTFNSLGKSVLVYNEGATDSDVTFNKCTFTATQSSDDKAAIEIDSTYSDFNVTITDCTVSGFADTVTGHDLDETKQVKSNVWHEKENKYVPTKVTDIVVEGDKTTVYTKSDAHGEHTVTVNETTTPEPTPSKNKTKKYDVIIKSADNGDVEVDDDYAKRGQEITITVDPDKGYELDELTITDQNGDEVDYEEGKKDNTFVFDMPKSDVMIEASFDKESSSVADKDDEDKEDKEDVSDKEDEDASKDDAEQEYIRLTIGQKIVWMFDEYVVNDVAPEIKNERTMLPIRIIAEALGATVTWNEAEQKVTITEDDLVIEIFIGQPFATVNGEPVQLDAPAYIANDRTYLPLRFVAENLGATVEWNAADSTVTIFE